MNLNTGHIEQILRHLPDTSVVVFREELEIMKVLDGGEGFTDLVPEIGDLDFLSNIPNPKWNAKIGNICRKALEGKEETEVIKSGSGKMKLHVFSVLDTEGERIGFLMVSGLHRKDTRDRDELRREKDEAEEISEVKSRFMARISHEIRTPLNAIIGFIEQLQKTEVTKAQEQYLKIVDKSSVYLLDLVNEILTFSKLESGEQQLDSVDFKIESLFREIYQTFKNRAAEKKINLRYSFDEKLKLILRGDTVRLKQIVINLVSNAIKFTEYGYVELSVGWLREEKNRVWIRITVEDTGIGISEKKIRDIFKEYKQASAGITRKHGGTGLGLTISKRLTELMNGRIEVRSTEGKGSEFTAEIPLEKSLLKELTEDTLRISTDVLSGKSALIVDDDAMNRMLGQIILEEFGMDISLASDGKEAMEILERNRFDVILLDIHMPVVSGLEVANYIRKELKDQGVRIIAVTADMVKEELERYLKFGIDDVLIKPYREINMFNKLCEVLGIGTGGYEDDPAQIVLKQEDEATLYDLSELQKVTKGSKDFFNEMVETFISNARAGVEQILAAYEKEDWKEIRDTAHRLVPSFKHFSVKPVVSDLIELKEECGNGLDKDRIEVLVRRIGEDTGTVIAQLNQEIMPEKEP